MFKSFYLESSNIILNQYFIEQGFIGLKSYNSPKLDSMNYKNWFMVDGAEPKKQKLDAYLDFEQGLFGFSVEMRSLLIEEFLEANNIYLN